MLVLSDVAARLMDEKNRACYLSEPTLFVSLFQGGSEAARNAP